MNCYQHRAWEVHYQWWRIPEGRHPQDRNFRIGGLARWDNGTLSFGAEVRHAFAQDRVPPAVSEEDPSGIATDAYTLVHLSAGYNLTLGARVHSIAVRVDNLTDEQYRDAASRIKSFAYNPGRNISVVYKVLF